MRALRRHKSFLDTFQKRKTILDQHISHQTDILPFRNDGMNALITEQCVKAGGKLLFCLRDHT